jgi:hypothetical protein
MACAAAGQSDNKQNGRPYFSIGLGFAMVNSLYTTRSDAEKRPSAGFASNPQFATKPRHIGRDAGMATFLARVWPIVRMAADFHCGSQNVQVQSWAYKHEKNSEVSVLGMLAVGQASLESRAIAVQAQAETIVTQMSSKKIATMPLCLTFQILTALLVTGIV